jgi:hypothetical protein
MTDDIGFAELVREIMAQGIDEQTASRYAGLIGDTPITDFSGYVLVRNEAGQLLAKLKPLKMFEHK